MKTANELDAVDGSYVLFEGEQYFRIANSHLMPDFFMSLVGASDHWMFVSSNGALTAGRQNSDNSLFPYSSDDQISATRRLTGPTTLIRVGEPERWGLGEPVALWEPFAEQQNGFQIRRNLYKTPLGNKLIFEEINDTLKLAFRYRWAFSEKFGFVRSCCLENRGSEACSFELLDGFRNLLPHGLGTEFQMRFSNLGNAYKKNELLPESNLGLFYLSSIPSDKAEPSEGLRATTVWQAGLEPSAVLLSSDQLSAFQNGEVLTTEADVRGKAGAYLLNHSAELKPAASIDWLVVAEVAQDHSDIVELDQWLQQTSDMRAEVADDVRHNEQEFLRIVSSSDAIQCSENERRVNRHLSNTVFNVMRGGIPLENYTVQTHDFSKQVAGFNARTFEKQADFLNGLPATIDAAELRRLISEQGDPDLRRLGLEYLPLAFSRRHGDPTRPWNQFSIDLRAADGSTNVNYQGNWRDIFQNWEALGLSFPEFFPSMICRFVNATTADGYNPYRVTKAGFEWEEPTPGDPWANIGYWGDHQIIYLLKLLEWSQRIQGEQLDGLLDSAFFVHANVPYRILDDQQIRKDPANTIEFDVAQAARIAEQVKQIGTDGKLLRNSNDEIHYVTLMEKLLTLSLAKLSNFVPDGGIWLNTQRPEWNDANNALVGNGLSMVTTCYLHRWFRFLHNWVKGVDAEQFALSQEVAQFFANVNSILQNHATSLGNETSPAEREAVVASLTKAGSDYRQTLYDNGVSGSTVTISRQECLSFLETARQHVEATIRNNRRSDGLYHAYNLIDWNDNGVAVEHLYEMLEGQVAVLSSGLLTAKEAVQLLDALRQSKLYRSNQNSYLLYPDRQLARFLSKNVVCSEVVNGSPLLQALIAAGDTSIVRRDVKGQCHFNGQFRNSCDLLAALDGLEGIHQPLVAEERQSLAQAFEDTFGHRQFTGRSGTFFAYEGLGSIYWHMVSKLGLAVSEHFFDAVEAGEPSETVEALRSHLIEIRNGIGAEKTPDEYGAFPSDPYSHTPENAGVRQPGMTGQVKEDVLARFAEIGIQIEYGCLCFRLELFDRAELVMDDSGFTFCDLAGKVRTIQVPQGGFGFTLFQVPFVYQPGKEDLIRVQFTDGKYQEFHGLQIDEATSRQLFSRSGNVMKVECQFKALSG